MQTAEAFSQLLGDRRGAKVVVLHGGVSINPQQRSLGGGADVVIATPGRLLDVLDSNAASVAGVRTLLLDEADRLLGPEFAAELDAILERLPPPGARQTLLFSATFPFKSRPKARRLLCRDRTTSLRIHSDGTCEEADGDVAPRATSAVAANAGTIGAATALGAAVRRRERPTSVERYASAPPPETIAQRAIRVDLRDRTSLLRHLLDTQGWGRVLVFVGSRKGAEYA